MVSISIGGFTAITILCFVAGMIAVLFMIALTSANGDDEK